MLLYVDDIFHLSQYQKKYIGVLNFKYELKEEIFVPPKRYPGSNVKKVGMDNGKEFYPIHCLYYLQVVINNEDCIVSKDNDACIKQYRKGNR